LRHGTVLELALDMVGMVWAGLLKKHLEVVCTWPHQVSIAMHGGQDLSHAGAARFPTAVIATAGHGRGPQRALLAPLVCAFDAVLGAVSDDVGWCLLVAAQGRFLLTFRMQLHKRMELSM
jgi:hypothetical protein